MAAPNSSGERPTGGALGTSAPGWYGPAVPALIAVLALVVAVAGG